MIKEKIPGLQEESLEDKIGVREGSRIIPIIVMAITVLFFIPRIKEVNSPPPNGNLTLIWAEDDKAKKERFQATVSAGQEGATDQSLTDDRPAVSADKGVEAEPTPEPGEIFLPKADLCRNGLSLIEQSPGKRNSIRITKILILNDEQTSSNRSQNTASLGRYVENKGIYLTKPDVNREHIIVFTKYRFGSEKNERWAKYVVPISYWRISDSKGDIHRLLSSMFWWANTPPQKAIETKGYNLQLVWDGEKIEDGTNQVIISQQIDDTGKETRIYEIIDSNGKKLINGEKISFLRKIGYLPDDDIFTTNLNEGERQKVIEQVFGLAYPFDPPKKFEIGFKLLKPVALAISYDLPRFIKFILTIGGIVALFAVFPGLAGMFYRRNFPKYFLASAAVLLLIEILAQMNGFGSVAQDQKEAMVNPLGFYMTLLGVFFGWLLLTKTRPHNLFGGPLSGFRDTFYNHWPFSWPKRKGERGGKNIVICLDGSWNHPGQTDHGHLAHTNVLKVFNLLKGDLASKKQILKKSNANLVKRYKNNDSEQVAFYYNGVGNIAENAKFGEMFGGIFGMGADGIRERAYLDIIKEYNPGDKIYIFGFSRGAAIARIVANDIGKRGIPRTIITLRLLGQLRPILKFLRHKEEHVKVNVLGCWDTVGSFGIAKDIFGIPFQKIDLLKNLTIGDHVVRAYHLVALDEQRDAFVPTLMDDDPTNPDRIVELWFSGNHSNVGGGYHTDKLSNQTLDFMLQHVSSGYCHPCNVDDNGKMRPMGDETWGLFLDAFDGTPGSEGLPEIIAAAQRAEEIKANPPVNRKIVPDPKGRIRTSGGPFIFAPRKLPIDAVIHDSVFERMGDEKSKYAPESLRNLSLEIALAKIKINEDFEKYQIYDSFSDDEKELVMRGLKPKITIRKWSSEDNTDCKIDYAKDLKHTV